MTDSAETKLARLEERHEAMVERVDKLESAVGDIEKCVAKLTTSVSLITWKVGLVIGGLLFIGQIVLKKLGLT